MSSTMLFLLYTLSFVVINILLHLCQGRVIWLPTILSIWQVGLNRNFYMQPRKNKPLNRHASPCGLGSLQVSLGYRHNHIGNPLTILLYLISRNLVSRYQVSFSVSLTLALRI